MTEDKVKGFFMPRVQLNAADIRKVKIVDSSTCSVLKQRFHVRMVINDEHVFTGEESLLAAEELRQCGFYSDIQYSRVKTELESLLAQERLVYGNEQ